MASKREEIQITLAELRNQLLLQKGKELTEAPSRFGNYISGFIIKIYNRAIGKDNPTKTIPLKYHNVNYFVLLRILKFCNSYKKLMFGPKSETSAFAPWQDTDIQAQKTWQEKGEQNTIEKYIFSKANVKYKSIDFENMKGNTLETGLENDKAITTYNICTKPVKEQNTIEKTNIIEKTCKTKKNNKIEDTFTEYVNKPDDIEPHMLTCDPNRIIEEKEEIDLYNNLFNKFITGKNIKFGIVKSDYQKDFNLLILKSKQYFKNDTKGINYENEKKEYNKKTQLLITIGYLYFIKSTYESCMFGISKYFKKGDKSSKLLNNLITAVYYILLFLIGAGTAGTGLLAVGYIFMTIDMVKTELLFRNIKYASMEIVDNPEKIDIDDDDKQKITNEYVLLSDKDLIEESESTVGGTKKKRKNKTKRKNKYNRKTRK